MPRIKPVDPATATGKTKEVLDAVQKKFGRIPNLLRGLANSPAAAEAYLGLGNTLSKGLLSPRVREQIALVVAQTNGCQYCLSAHTAIGKMVGLQESEIEASREGSSAHPKTLAILRLARTLVSERGWITDEQLQQAREAGVSDGELAEVVANVALNTLSNYFNHVAGTEVDFPQVPVSLQQTA